MPFITDTLAGRFASWQPSPWDENLAHGVYPIEQTVCLIITGHADQCALGLITMELLHDGGLLDLVNTVYLLTVRPMASN